MISVGCITPMKYLWYEPNNESKNDNHHECNAHADEIKIGCILWKEKSSDKSRAIKNSLRNRT